MLPLQFRRLIVTHKTLSTVPPIVLPLQQHPHDKHNDQLKKMAKYHAPDAQWVRRRLASLVEERACDVADAVAEEENGGVDDFLSVPGCVCGLEREEDHEGGVDGAREVVAD